MPIGEAILPISVVFLLANVGWQWTWISLTLSVSVLSLFAIMIYPKLQPYKPTHSTSSNSETTFKSHIETDITRKQVLKTGKFWLLVMAIMFPAFAITALFFHQQIWLVDKGLSLKQFAAALSLYALMHILGSLFSGWMVDKFGLNKMLRHYMIPMTLGVVSLLLFSGELSLYSFMLLTGITVGASGPVSGSLWPILYGSTNLGAIRGTITALMVISTAIAPALLGTLSAAGWKSEQLILLLSGYGIAAVMTLKFIKLQAVTT
jgi:MFS family permease